MKVQALSDFVVECQFDILTVEENPFTPKAWTLFVDGSSTTSSGGAGVILIGPEGFKIHQALKFSFSVTNNLAEYEALLAGIRLAIELEKKVLEICGDSQLVANQLNGEFKAHDGRMAAYLALSISLLEKNSLLGHKNVCREENLWDDALSKLASSVVSTTEAIYVEERNYPSIDVARVNEVSATIDRRQPIL
ncbi:uncharacterized protein LOC141674623 [Apium graveolens]|uniref:uncharacterized protein LOC141674623 n=1 Tax=Apium graveolens TaxID=4045 RepID=UPI003D792B4C